MKTVGVPRALLYYEFFPLWETFFKSLGVEIIVSNPTTKATLDLGVSAAVDETCLPVKVFYGHFLELVNLCDLVFLPRLVSLEPKTYICPKFMGLPDLLRSLGYDNLIDPVVDLRNPRKYLEKLWQAVVATGRAIGEDSPTKIGKALLAGMNAQHKYRAQLYHGLLPTEIIDGLSDSPPPKGAKAIGVIGHPYMIFDDLINVNLLSFLRSQGYQVLTPSHYHPAVLEKVARSLPKELFWMYGRRMVGAARLWSELNSVAGIIHLETFGCGTDSIVGELIERLTRRYSDLPYMLLTVDEHSGEAGFRTRLEAFCDMIEFKSESADLEA